MPAPWNREKLPDRGELFTELFGSKGIVSRGGDLISGLLLVRSRRSEGVTANFWMKSWEE